MHLASARPRLDVAVGLLVVTVAVLAAIWLLAGAGDAGDVDGAPSFSAMPVTAALGYGGTGLLLAWLGRATVVRRILLAIGATQALGTAAATYAEIALAAHGETALVVWTHWLGSWLWAPGFVAVGTVLPHVLPTGRPLWRPALVWSGLAVTWIGVWWALLPYHLQDFPTTTGLVNPVGVPAIAELGWVSDLLILPALVLAIASVVVRWRQSTGVERDQLVWLLLGVVLTIVVAVTGVLLGETGAVLSALAMLPVPASIAVALLRHRLWDVDVVVSRSLLYALLTGAVVATYVVAVALLAALVGDTAGAPVVATAAVALLVLPVHTRLQRLVNRLVHGDVQDPYAALARLGERLEAAADPGQLAERVLPELVAQVARVLRVPYAAVVLADGARTECGTEVSGQSSVPLVYAGTQVGALVVGRAPLSRADRRVLESLARQAAVAVHSVLLARDVQHARTASATAAEEERRRLRRDLHDGLGPALAALALQAETARDLVASDPEAATRLLARLVPRLNDTVADVRVLVHDLRPPTLDELGLAGAVRELATRFATPTRSVVVDAGELGSLSAAVDQAAYRIAAEALANAARHADATALGIEVSVIHGELRLRVTDDGVGIREARLGVGLRSMRERAEELGGTCRVRPRPEGGTEVLAVIPTGLPESPRVPEQREQVLT